MATGQEFGGGAGAGRFHTGGGRQGLPASPPWSSPRPGTSSGNDYYPDEVPGGDIRSATHETPWGDVTQVNDAGPRGDVHAVAGTRFEAVRGPAGPGFQPAHDSSQTRQHNRMFGVAGGSLADP